MSEQDTPSYMDANNPAWEPFLEAVPKDYHEQVIPVLKEWDQGVQKQFETYAPYKQLVEQGFDPDDIYGAIGYAAQLQEDPIGTYNQLHAYLKENNLLDDSPEEEEEVEYVTTDENGEEVPAADPEIVQQLVEYVVNKESYEKDQALLAAYNQEVNELQEYYQEYGYGEFDEDWVDAKVRSSDMDLEDAVRSYYEWEESKLAELNRPSIPRAMGSSGVFDVAEDVVDPSKLNEDQLKEYAKDVLKMMNREG